MAYLIFTKHGPGGGVRLTKTKPSYSESLNYYVFLKKTGPAQSYGHPICHFNMWTQHHIYTSHV